MLPFNEFTLAISAIIMVLTSIIGVVLLSTSVFKINSSLKQTVSTIEKFQRPFLTIKIANKHFKIKNTGKSQAVIDSITINDSDEMSGMENKSINPEQTMLIKHDFDNEENLSLEIIYHDENNTYKEDIDL
ncbi:hypothetical protein M5C72_06460 [Companilactobacillus allii]|uniref:Uncharacterized protein n=1 Tax=Companilactobacillus allii TaxID=1847728 RepID=A0A1P8Q4J1_9LACO|nr:hypothetical protein [Companilactobacillus allii]APX72743.1 hypothetical protein BTM29_09360 [Companilactobacillus allii]USQ67529.1 hypothetical protein M5C72_06460 [Companilactobacillus allii]